MVMVIALAVSVVACIIDRVMLSAATVFVFVFLRPTLHEPPAYIFYMLVWLASGFLPFTPDLM